MSAPRMSAAMRMQRLLALLQWVADQPGGADVAAVCERFNLGRSDLVRELDLASMIGAESVDYDEMPFEVFIEDGRVFAHLFSFRRPLRLSPAEALALVGAADALLGQDPDPTSPLARALAKLGRPLQVDPDEVIDVDLDPSGGPTARLLAGAMEQGRRVAFTYWSYGRDAVAPRRVDPWRVVSDGPAWYLIGLDVGAGAERRFRLDRIDDLEVLAEEATPSPPEVDTAIAVPDGAPRVVLDLPAEARWVAEAYPVVAADTLEDGRLRVTLAVYGRSWLERLLLRVGPAARIVAIDAALGGPDLLSEVAGRVLARYRGGGTPGPR